MSEQRTDDREEWGQRLRAARGHVVPLSQETVGRPVAPDLSDLGTEPDLVLAAGTVVRYEETRYDSMRPDQAFHFVKVVSGPVAGRWVFIRDVVGPGPLPWED